MLVIEKWMGRLGQIVLTILRAIHYAKLRGHNQIYFPKVELLTSNTIILDNTIKDIKSIFKHTFFYLKNDLDIDDPEPYLMKQYFLEYIKPIFKLTYRKNIDEDNVYIHIRSEDMYISNPHPSHIPSPLAYYEYIIDKMYPNYNIVIIAADKIDPCINILLQRPNVSFFSSGDLLTDLYQFTEIKHFVFSTGLLDFLMYLMNDKLEVITMPDYTYQELVQGSYGNDLKLNVIEIPNYIKLKEWHNYPQQFKQITEYKLPDNVIVKTYN